MRHILDQPIPPYDTANGEKDTPDQAQAIQAFSEMALADGGPAVDTEYDNVDYTELLVATMKLQGLMNDHKRLYGKHVKRQSAIDAREALNGEIHTALQEVAQYGRPGAQVIMHYADEYFWKTADDAPLVALQDSLVSQYVLGHMPILFITDVIDIFERNKREDVEWSLTHIFTSVLRARLFPLAAAIHDHSRMRSDDLAYTLPNMLIDAHLANPVDTDMIDAIDKVGVTPTALSKAMKDRWGSVIGDVYEYYQHKADKTVIHLETVSHPYGLVDAIYGIVDLGERLGTRVLYDAEEVRTMESMRSPPYWLLVVEDCLRLLTHSRRDQDPDQYNDPMDLIVRDDMINVLHAILTYIIARGPKAIPATSIKLIDEILEDATTKNQLVLAAVRGLRRSIVEHVE